LNPKTGEEYDNKTGLKTFWELLDSGMLHKRGEFWNVRTPLKVLEFMSKICLKCHMDIKDGVWVNAEECLKDFKAYDIQKFREVFNFELENTHEIKQQDENRTITSEDETSEPKPINPDEVVIPFFIKESYLERIIGLYDKSTGQISDVLDIYHRLEKMDCDQIIDFIFEVYESAKKGYDLKFNDSIIFVIANLDEAYQISFDVNPDMSPDQFRKITEKISIVEIKEALKKRFRNEQITRLGNIQVIYPSFSEQNFRDLIQMSLDNYAKEAYKLTGYVLEFDDTIKQIIYEEGVFPTHGTRPIFSTVHEIVKSKFPEIIRNITENELIDRIYSIKYTFDTEHNIIVVYCHDIHGFVVTNITFDIKLRLKKLRDSDINDEEQALCALHESGHFVMYAKLFGKMPEKLVSRTTDNRTGGFLMEDVDEAKKKVSKRDMLNEIKVLLGGYVAEKYVFGEEMTSGASNDLFRATQLASRVVRRFGMGSFAYVATNTDEQDDPEGLLIKEENQIYINREIKDIINNAENEIRHVFADSEWRKMLKQSALYLCNNSAMSKEKMKEIYDNVADDVKMSVRSDKFYHDSIENI
jgi:cell division protease FtsH